MALAARSRAAASPEALGRWLAETGTDVRVADSAEALRDGIGTLLTRAQQAGAVRADVQIAEVMALLISTCQGALQSAWDEDLQRRALAVIFAGLRPTGYGSGSRRPAGEG